MAELTERAGLVPPEFEATGTNVLVRFRPIRYVAPTRVNHDLSPLQREILGVLAEPGRLSLGEISTKLPKRTALRTVQDNLKALRLLHLVESRGRGQALAGCSRAQVRRCNDVQ